MKRNIGGSVALFGRLFWILALWMAFASVTGASTRKVDPGELPALKEGEGLLLMAIDTNVPISHVRILKEGRDVESASMRNLPTGQSYRLIVAPAGTYQWSSLRYFGVITYALKDDPEYRFEVKPGVITYGGDLLFRPSSYTTAAFHMANRGLQALDWLESQHPKVIAQHEFEFSGLYPDPFPAFYRTKRSAKTIGADKVPEVRTDKAPNPTSVPKADIWDLWKPDRIRDIAFNSKGDLLAMSVRESEDIWAVDLVDFTHGASTRLMTSPYEFDTMAWSGDTTLLTSVGTDPANRLITVHRAFTPPSGGRKFESINLRRRGRIVDPLAAQPDHFLLGTVDTRGEWMVHRVDISTRKAIAAIRTDFKERLNTGLKDDFAWYADASGTIRAVLVRKDKTVQLHYGRPGNFSSVLDLTEAGSFRPQALSADGALIYGLSDDGRGQRDLVAFDPVNKRVIDTLSSKPGVDAVGPLFDSQRSLIGAAYVQNGHLISEFFDNRNRNINTVLSQAFPDKNVMGMARSIDQNQWMLVVEGSDQPARLYHLDVPAKRASLIAPMNPALEKRNFAPASVVRTTGKEGLAIEGYLTLPRDKSKPPLVIFPHGGPIDVRDSLSFDPQVQFLAAQGYAVLQVNFRGSDGYGKAFREAGKKRWGGAIEDDIDAMLAHVLQRFPLDASRMCVLGGSYGGYSAMISTVRWPGRFRCAVSINGVSDRLLSFTASDSARHAATRKWMEEYMGNPRSEQLAMMELSPLYQYEKMQEPVMLVHGREDWRVDYEHTRRLVRMFNLAGKAPVVISFDKEAHGIADIDNIKAAWTGIAGFLERHLDNRAAGPLPAAGAAPAMTK